MTESTKEVVSHMISAMWVVIMLMALIIDFNLVPAILMGEFEWMKVNWFSTNLELVLGIVVVVGVHSYLIFTLPIVWQTFKKL